MRQSDKRKKYICFCGITLIIIIAMILIGPMDFFHHGFYCDVVEIDDISDEDIQYIDLGEQSVEQIFSPQKRHFAGIQLAINNTVENNGLLELTIYNEKKDLIDKISINLNEVPDNTWYHVYINKALKKNHIYTIKIEAKDCDTFPQILKVDADYLSEENIDGNILLGYAYAKPTFNLAEKIFIGLLMFAVWLFLICAFMSNLRRPKRVRNIAFCIVLFVMLAWNYSFNIMDNLNTKFVNFADSSEMLVLGPIMAEENEVLPNVYGLGVYINSLARMDFSTYVYLTDDNWNNGYSRTLPCILISNNEYTKNVAVTGNYIEFANGDFVQISDVEEAETYLRVYFRGDKLSFSKQGNLFDIKFYNADKVLLPKGILWAYQSQFGLQGKAFRHMAHYLTPEMKKPVFRLLCSMMLAAIFILIVILLNYKYNLLMAGCFYITFLLSPWIVNFAPNLYWVEFTWFIPMLIGLWCACFVRNPVCRILSYIGVFVAILIKSLCGYEYITTIMLASVSILLVDLMQAAARRDKKMVYLLFKTVFCVGSAALLGFIVALCIHALLRGSGNIAAGIKSIFETDILRRVGGGSLNMFDEILWPSLNASVWEVLCRYFKFDTQIITGISANMFPIICLMPVGIFVFNNRKKRLNLSDVFMYSVFFLTSISWFVLGKSHSYVHTHLNYVLWYFGFIQICFYIICKQCVMFCSKRWDLEETR